VVIDPGAVFEGDVVAAGPGNTLELGSAVSTGTIDGLGTSFAGFATVAVDAGATWSLLGDDSLAAGATISVGAGGALGIVGALRVGGALTLAGGGTLVVAPAGSLEVGTAGGATSGRTTIDAGNTLSGVGTLRGTVLDKGMIVANPGMLVLAGGISGAGAIAIDSGSVLSVTGKLAAHGLAFLVGGGETLKLGKPGSATTKLSGFGAGDTIDLVKTVGTAASFAGGVLTVSGTAGSVATLHFAGHYSSANFLLATDHHGGTTISFV